MDTSETGVKRLQDEVIERARWYMEPPRFINGPGRKLQAGTWVEALELAANDLCEGWEWRIVEFIGSSHENAHFFLTQYNGRV